MANPPVAMWSVILVFGFGRADGLSAAAAGKGHRIAVGQDGRVTPGPEAHTNDAAAESDRRMLTQACQLATEAASTDGGPFGAVVVHNGAVVAAGTNRVTADRDPTAHAEITALRAAARALDTNDLSGCVLYASCRPCPMCQAATWWARVDRVVYSASDTDAAAAGFDDTSFWAAMRGAGPEPISTVEFRVDATLEPFEAWAANADRVEY